MRQSSQVCGQLKCTTNDDSYGVSSIEREGGETLETPREEKMTQAQKKDIPTQVVGRSQGTNYVFVIGSHLQRGNIH